MLSTPLRQFLQSLCCDSPWDYAVFWKFQQLQNQLFLIWEDGLFEISRPLNPMEGMMDSSYLNNRNEKLASTCAESIHNGKLSNFPLGVLMNEMSSVYYSMGKGLIGEVAFTESPNWILVDDYMAGGFNSNVISECPDELFHQFVAGIKTILLVPFAPHGVVQLGSMDTVTEDAGLVINVCNKFNAYQPLAECCSPFNYRNYQVKSTDLMSPYTDCLLESFCTASVKADEDLKFSCDVGIEGHQISNKTQISTDMMTTIDRGSESEINIQSLIDFAQPENHQMWEISDLEMMQNFLGSYLDEEIDCLPNFSGQSIRNGRNCVAESLHSYSDDGILVLEDCGYASHASEIQVMKFPRDCELHKALGHVLQNQSVMVLSGQNASANSAYAEDTICINVPSVWDSGGECPSKVKSQNLLEAVVANASNISDDCSSNRSHSTTASKSSSLKRGSSQFGLDTVSEESQVPGSCVTSAISGDRHLDRKISPSTSSFGCMINALLEVQPARNGNGVTGPIKGSKLTDSSKRSARSGCGDSQKTRPRDRQLIQDRIKELRDLVPNGAQCSIDGLLDRTIKHMQFLTSVTDQAEKVRQHTEKKSSIRKEMKLPKVESNAQNGTSWALELENEQQTCPIFVKDGDYPGHMLIEMLCGDNGRFLEIADVIHRLDLTILKGSMEKRCDESAWARFIVEASESFQRLDIFWPLMQLLQQNRAQISSKIYLGSSDT